MWKSMYTVYRGIGSSYGRHQNVRCCSVMFNDSLEEILRRRLPSYTVYPSPTTIELNENLDEWRREAG